MRKLFLCFGFWMGGLVLMDGSPYQYHGQITGGGMNHYSGRFQSGETLPPPVLEPKDLYRVMATNSAVVQATVRNGFTWVEGQVVGYDGSMVLISQYGRVFAVDKFPRLPIGTSLTIDDRYTAMLQPGTVLLDRRTQAYLFDYGIPYKGKAWTRSNQDQAKIDLKTFQWLSTQATNGSASAQCSLGIYYLNGKGCETNKEAAIYWLKNACNQGDEEASNTLAKIEFKTNSVASSH
jgi:TPR repeat protein